ncbi:GATOR complex protein mio [Oratosquilla oratoria]|uniref:GATOR complex protein mio n=1 Tax=Oratosquilla oratoria TaxID=337810 RepID=UPI003F75C07C
MSSVRLNVQWSPVIEDQFLTWGSDLQLYQAHDISASENVQAPKLQLGPRSAATLLGTNNDIQYIKCVAWCPAPEPQPHSQIIAVGQATGKVTFTSFSKGSYSKGLKGREFMPKHARPVNSLSWSTLEPHLLAAALDRARADNSILVWDVTRSSPSTTSTLGYEGRNSHMSDTIKPVIEFGTPDTSHSVCFFTNASHTLLAGMNNKHIKMFDLRESKVITTVPTKAVYGICMDPHSDRRFASFVDNQVHVWDMRNLERPVLCHNDPKPITKLAWCPTRHGFLASLSMDSHIVRLYDIQYYGVGAEDQEPTFTTRSISTDQNNYLSGFTWHPMHENRIVTVSYSGKLVDYTVHERITLNWSVMNDLLWTQGKNTLHYMDHNHEGNQHSYNISTDIMKRAQAKYGLNTSNLAANGDLTDDLMLKNLWNWLDAAKGLAQSANFKLPGGVPYKYQGVRTLLSLASTKSDIINKPWIGLEGNRTLYCKMFRSEERHRALELCSWGFDNDSLLNSFLSCLENSGEYTRAAAVAVFNLHIRQAIQILQRGSGKGKDPTLNTTAMAMAGFTDERKALWRDTCINLRAHLVDPYLRAVFAFLTGDADSYDPVLGETNMALQDRVAFACLYLSDVRLTEYLDKLGTKLVEEGNLDGILLTGLGSDGIDLIQRYVDLSGDMQTAALITIHALQSAMEKDLRLQNWVQSYRDLLDNLRLWNERAELDVVMNRNKHAQRPPQHIYISCNFCMKSISAYIQTPGRLKNPYARFGTGAANKSKMSWCPNCRKPLPRCSLCLVHMGTPSGWSSNSSTQVNRSDDISIDHNESVGTSGTQKLSDFSSWFTWCQTCRHGGHANHTMEWFKEHAECPVTSCNCKCMSIDPISKVASLPAHK